MCGIAGVYRFDGGRVERGPLEAMTARMLHRGPDDEGFYRADAVGLGMRRLSIIDLTGGHQPLGNEDGTVWVVMNGEIYNYVELRAELEAKGHRFRTRSDTETIVHLYEEEGTEAVRRLNGMFAFALYDAARRALWVVRDRLGVKPLFYTEHAGALYFASDLDALVAGIGSREVDRAAFLRYLGLGYVPHPHSIYAGVQKLSPGEWLWVSREGVRVEPYWRVAMFESWRGTDVEAAAQLRHLLDDAVRLELRSDVPLGVFLSGGLDSSAVVALAASRVDRPLRTLTVAFAGKASADEGFAREVASAFATEHRELALTSAEAARGLEELIPFLDEPIADSAVIPSYLLAREARAEGIKVLLTGAGGDEMFGGYRRHHWPRAGSATWLAEVLPARARAVASRALAAMDPERAVLVRDPRIAFGAGISGASLALCAGALRRREDAAALLDGFTQTFGALSAEGRPEHGFAYLRMSLDLGEYLVGNVLALLDKSTMACSVEGRVPLLDHRLVEFAFALPASLNLLEGRPKGLFRRALRGLLPEALVDRGKDGFNAPMGVWIDDALGARIDAELCDGPIDWLDDLFDLDVLRAAARDPRRRRRAAETLYSLFVFSRWYRSHVDK
jgi:asparagine synthase (glutamine-hydrolysing)